VHDCSSQNMSETTFKPGAMLLYIITARSEMWL
jgi:hypothetical protein